MIEHGDTHTSLSNPSSMIYDLKTDDARQSGREKERGEILSVSNTLSNANFLLMDTCS